jgi:hypothetical protein
MTVILHSFIPMIDEDIYLFTKMDRRACMHAMMRDGLLAAIPSPTVQ